MKIEKIIVIIYNNNISKHTYINKLFNFKLSSIINGDLINI
jgi:hypothetical protein